MGKEIISEEVSAAREHRSALTATYLTVGIAFVSMVVINLVAYFTIIQSGKTYSAIQTATNTIKLKTTSANLMFREIMSGASTRDMKQVWNLIKESKDISGQLDKFVPKKTLEDKLEAFKKSMLEMQKFYQGRKDEDVQDAFEERRKLQRFAQAIEKALVDVTREIEKVDKKVEANARGSMRTFNMLYIALFANILILFGFIVYFFTNYIHQRQKVEREMRNTRNNLTTILNSVESMLITVDKDCAVLQWNNAAEKYASIPAARAVGKKVETLVPFLKDFLPHVQTVFLSKKTKEFYRERIVTDRERFFSIVMTYNQGLDGVVIRADDVTVQELSDEQLRQSQKMEVVENLIGGLAHDFNNVLGAITGTISLLKYSLENKGGSIDDVKANMDVIESSAERAVVMVQQLLSLSTKDAMKLAPIDLNMIGQHVLKICENTFDKRIELVADLYDVKALALADTAQLAQVLLNLCDNSAQAMTTMRPEGTPQGGRLTMSIDRFCPDKVFRVGHPAAVDDSYWVISVKDTGVGIPPDIVTKIFDPFFTTKEKGEGTGLGLTMVNETIKRHNGFMEVFSRPGEITVFRIYIPEYIQEGPASAAPAIVEAEEQIPVGSGLILVVDDEGIMRKTAKGILEKLGYQVILAEDGEEAVNIFRERHDEIALTLLDMAMPKKSGKEAYIDMKQIQPDLKTLLVSGFKRDDRIIEVLELGINGFVQKPYSMVTLAQEVKKLIGDAPPQSA
ncbi:MAG: hypothetical protein A2X49_17320 [Lentisphaerae bacterium GWF2_52_8]|nr:MAG: hypothetical protein A2X49_17320 [Lentisphaerae bacterium GWF2_52_8]